MDYDDFDSGDDDDNDYDDDNNNNNNKFKFFFGSSGFVSNPNSIKWRKLNSK